MAVYDLDYMIDAYDDAMDKESRLVHLYLLSGIQETIAGLVDFDFQKAQNELCISSETLSRSLRVLFNRGIVFWDPWCPELFISGWFDCNPILSNHSAAAIINLYLTDNFFPLSLFPMNIVLSSLRKAITEQDQFECDDLLLDFLTEEIAKLDSGNNTPPNDPPFPENSNQYPFPSDTCDDGGNWGPYPF